MKTKRTLLTVAALGAALLWTPARARSDSPALSYVIVDTGQQACYDNFREIECPPEGAAFHGQDAQHQGVQPSYKDNGDGTVTDRNTGLMWTKDPGPTTGWDEAVAAVSSFRLAGYTDWRVPTIKELYSLIQFTGVTHPSAAASTPYIDTDYFVFSYGDESAGVRFIDCQYLSSTEYIGTTMGGHATIFGVNFADGRIKGYPKRRGGYYVPYVRGNPDYGKNQFVDNGDGTVTDLATGLMWQQRDSGRTLNWEDALAYANSLELAGYDDWRLPNAKELQSIVDYTRAPAQTKSAAIDPVFSVADNESYYWTSTTHLDGAIGKDMVKAVYVAFGRALGYMRGRVPIDVHGAGAQRSDPKTGDPAAFPYGFGPQGDDIRIFNYARAVRGPVRAPLSASAR